MQAPTPEQIEAMIIEKFGAVPDMLQSAKKVDPRFLVEQAMSGKFSVNDEKNPFDAKTSLLIALTTSIAIGNNECVKEQTKRLKKIGLTQEELAYLVKIIKHAKASAVMVDAKDAFDTFMD